MCYLTKLKYFYPKYTLCWISSLQDMTSP
jgi:hypothetical protein